LLAHRQKFFEVDHPFIYLIWDYFTGSILMIGRVVRPIVL
jgi:serine protease inhibitor